MDTSLPEGFSDLEPYVADWALARARSGTRPDWTVHSTISSCSTTRSPRRRRKQSRTWTR
jgi:hypothetical protein